MRNFMVCFSVFACAVLSGCMVHRTSGIMVEGDRLYIEDIAFASNIEAFNSKCEKTSDGFLHAQVTLKNAKSYDFRCQYRFEWRGENGMIQTHQSAPWLPLVLHGREVKDLNAVSLQPNATDFRLVLRRED